MYVCIDEKGRKTDVIKEFLTDAELFGAKQSGMLFCPLKAIRLRVRRGRGVFTRNRREVFVIQFSRRYSPNFFQTFEPKLYKNDKC